MHVFIYIYVTMSLSALIGSIRMSCVISRSLLTLARASFDTARGAPSAVFCPLWLWFCARNLALYGLGLFLMQSRTNEIHSVYTHVHMCIYSSLLYIIASICSFIRNAVYNGRRGHSSERYSAWTDCTLSSYSSSSAAVNTMVVKS